MEFSALKSMISDMKSPAVAPKGEDWSASSTIMNAFKHLHAMAQASVITKLGKEHEKTVKDELKDKKGSKKVKDPNTPKRQQSQGVQNWQDLVKEEMIASGQKVDEKGNPVFKDGKPVYNITYKEAMVRASPKKKAAEEAGKAAPAVKKTNKTASEPSVTSASVRERVTAPITKRATFEEEDDEYESENLDLWTGPNGKNYWKSAMNECWICNPDHSRGAWMGIYNPVTRKFYPAEEPDI